MSWSLLQSTGNTVASGNGTATFGSNLSSGSVLIVCIGVDNAVVTDPVSAVALNDTAATALSRIKSTENASAENWAEVWAVATPSDAVGTKPTVTATVTTNFGVAMVILEVAGITASADGTPGGNNGTASPATGGTYSSSAANEFLLFCIGDNGTNLTYGTPTGTSGFTLVSGSQQANSNAECAVWRTNSVGGSESASSTFSGTSDWSSVLVAFPLSAPPAPTIVSETPFVFSPTVGAFSAWVNPNGASTTVSFNYGPTTGYGSNTGTVATLTGSTPQYVTFTDTGLTTGTTVHFQAVAVNSGGTTNGSDASFTTATVGTTNFSGLLGVGLLGGDVLGYQVAIGTAQTVPGSFVIPLRGAFFNRQPPAPRPPGIPLTGVVLVPAPVPHQYSASATDSLVFTDSAQGHLTVHGNATDSLVITDSARVSTQPAHATDAVVFSDTARLATQPAHATDSLVLSDSSSGVGPTVAAPVVIPRRGVLFNKQPPANIPPGSVLTGVVLVPPVVPGSHIGNASDTLVFTDSARASAQPAHATDAVVFSESARVSAQPAHSSDALVFTESVDIHTQPAHSSDSLVFTDSARVSAQPAHATDALVFSDSARTPAQPAHAADALVLSDSARLTAQPAHSTDALVLTDSARLAAQPAHSSDSLIFADTASAVGPGSHVGNASDTLVFSETARLVHQPAHSTDALVFSETARTPAQPAHGTDALVLSDSARLAAQPAHATDAVVFSDSARLVAQPVHATDALIFADTASAQGPGTHVGNATDSLLFTDAVRIASQKVHASDAVLWLDTATGVVHLGAKSTDTLVFSDTAGAQLHPGRAVNDALVFSDSARVRAQYAHATDALRFVDFANAIGPVHAVWLFSLYPPRGLWGLGEPGGLWAMRPSYSQWQPEAVVGSS